MINLLFIWKKDPNYLQKGPTISICFLILFFFLKIAIFRSPILPPQHAFLAFSKALCDQTLPKTIYASTHGSSHQIMSKAFQSYANELFPLMKIATSFLMLHLWVGWECFFVYWQAEGDFVFVYFWQYWAWLSCIILLGLSGWLPTAG